MSVILPVLLITYPIKYSLCYCLVQLPMTKIVAKFGSKNVALLKQFLYYWCWSQNKLECLSLVNVFKVYYTDSNISNLTIEFYIELNQAWAIQMTSTLDGKVILVLPNSQNFILLTLLGKIFRLIYFCKVLPTRIMVR